MTRSDPSFGARNCRPGSDSEVSGGRDRGLCSCLALNVSMLTLRDGFYHPLLPPVSRAGLWLRGLLIPEPALGLLGPSPSAWNLK